MLSHMRDHYCGLLTEADAGKVVHLSGWVQRTRDLGGVVFVWLRDREGLVQLVFDATVCSPEIFNLGRDQPRPQDRRHRGVRAGRGAAEQVRNPAHLH